MSSLRMTFERLTQGFMDAVYAQGIALCTSRKCMVTVELTVQQVPFELTSLLSTNRTTDKSRVVKLD